MADIVFMALHGENGENGKIQAAFDLFGIRYTGTGYLGSALAMNKGMAEQLFLENGIPTPRGTSLKRGEDAAKIEDCGIHFPVRGKAVQRRIKHRRIDRARQGRIRAGIKGGVPAGRMSSSLRNM